MSLWEKRAIVTKEDHVIFHSNEVNIKSFEDLLHSAYNVIEKDMFSVKSPGFLEDLPC